VVITELQNLQLSLRATGLIGLPVDFIRRVIFFIRFFVIFDRLRASSSRSPAVHSMVGALPESCNTLVSLHLPSEFYR
jgi:hypothetical protein